MRKIFLTCLLMSIFGCGIVAAHADDDLFIPMDQVLTREPDNTPCATEAFETALTFHANEVSEDAPEDSMRMWVHSVFVDGDTLRKVLDCPEVRNMSDTDLIKFQPIKYVFSSGREIVVNYETQPKILKQRVTLADKHARGTLSDPNPAIGTIDDTSVWVNTDPAWYAIMVTQAGALRNFVGPDKNNTVSLQYIMDNIDTLYPRGASCTDRTALADNNDMINLAVRETVHVEGDTNDYYVAGDADLRWIAYAEIGLDIVLMVVTWGGSAVAEGAIKGFRATKSMVKVRKVLQTLRNADKFPQVAKFIKQEHKLYRAQKNLRAIEKCQKIEKELSAIDKLTDAAKYADKSNELEKALRELREIDKVTDSVHYADKAKDLKDEVETVRKEMRTLMKDHKDVRKYARARKEFSELQQYRRNYKNIARAAKDARKLRSGNIAVRVWKTWRANRKSAKVLDRSARFARRSLKSGRTRDWLFHSTMRNATKLTRLTQKAGLLYAGIKIVGDMYDYTETSTGKYTNDIDLSPWLLLSADDINGQENEVNYGMWLMWIGDPMDSNVDDASFLEAMDFAEKFHQDLTDTMENHNNHACDVDIYVVHPIIRNPDTNPELYYLFMNDIPWTTHE